MDIQAALRDGYSKDEVMAELGRRTGMNYQQALQDGYSADDVLTEMSKRTTTGTAPTPEKPWGSDWDTLRTAGATLGGFAAMPVAGLGGLSRLITTGSLEEASKTMEDIASVPAKLMTTDRQRLAAEKVGGLISWPFVKAGEGWKAIGEETGIPYAGPVLGTMGEAAGILAMPAGLRAAKLGGKATLKVAQTGAQKAAHLIRPKPTAEQALGQVLQGKTKDLAKGKKALAAIDTTGVKTYADLSKKIDDAIPDYARKVDAELMKDPITYSLDDLSTVQKTKGGKDVTSNFVKDSIEHLEELYTKIGDPVKAGNMTELLEKVKVGGLTKKEVNDLARVYGSEFGDKAFSRVTGDALTSVNAQAYENVRQGLKEVARRGLSDSAKELDSTISSLYNTRKLISKNVEAANRLRQKIDERGLGEKIGRGVLVALDVATAGVVKGAVLKLLPRGLGYKVKNFIDLEESLARNLKIINDELKRIGKAEPARLAVPAGASARLGLPKPSR